MDIAPSVDTASPLLWIDPVDYAREYVDGLILDKFGMYLGQKYDGNDGTLVLLSDCMDAHRLALGTVAEQSTNQVDELGKLIGLPRPKDLMAEAIDTDKAVADFGPDRDQPPAPTFTPPKQGGKGPVASYPLNSIAELTAAVQRSQEQTTAEVMRALGMPTTEEQPADLRETWAPEIRRLTEEFEADQAKFIADMAARLGAARDGLARGTTQPARIDRNWAQKYITMYDEAPEGFVSRGYG